MGAGNRPRSIAILVSAPEGIYFLVGLETCVLQLWQAWDLPHKGPWASTSLGSSRWGGIQGRLPGGSAMEAEA